jgi:hypothetical protein
MHVILEDHITAKWNKDNSNPDEHIHGRAFAAEKVRKALGGPIRRNGCVIDIGIPEAAVLATEAHNAWDIGRGSLEDTEMSPSERAKERRWLRALAALRNEVSQVFDKDLEEPDAYWWQPKDREKGTW